jgi:cell wall-associated NlpC family hydrolase
VTKVGNRGGIGSPSMIGDDAAAKAVEELMKLKAEMAAKAAKGGVDSGAGTPNVANARAPADRAGAMATLEARPVGDAPADTLDSQITDKLRDMGYLPKPPEKVTKEQVDAATQKFIVDNLDNENISGDIELLIGLLEAKMQKQNARANGGGGGMRGARPPEGGRPSGLPAASNYANRGPAPNAGALQNQAAQNIANAKPPPEPGSIQARVAQAAQQYMGTSTAAGPDGGNLACAWSVNNILANAGIAKVGSNTNYVPSVEQALQGGRGTKIDPADAGPGDIVIWPNGHHIGIAMGNNQVANNSSSRASFSNMQALPPGCRVYRLNS